MAYAVTLAFLSVLTWGATDITWARASKNITRAQVKPTISNGACLIQSSDLRVNTGKLQHLELDTCASPPELDDQNLSELITGTEGLLLVAIKDMRCTAAIEAALHEKGIAATIKYFTSSAGQPGDALPSDASDVWKWLHCTYPDDDRMHSYVFVDGEFIGNGFQAADKVSNGQYDEKLGGDAKVSGQSCADKHPKQAKVVQQYMDDPENRVLLFGWQGCPCTGIAEKRLAASSICYQGRTWADPNSKLMTYLQCETKDTTHHSFVYFRNGQGDDSTWEFMGTGFDMDKKKMSEDALASNVESAGAKTACEKASVAVNVYGGPLEECQLPDDKPGGSWDDDGKCSETTGGIHQICIQAGTLPHDFSMNTYQNSDWSESRTDSSHCICVGAWSTYMTEEEKHENGTETITPRCKAIPETVLTKEYMAHWKDWNGFSANVGKGLAELVERCLTIDDVSAKCGLKTRFMKLNSDEQEIEKAQELDGAREELEQIECPAESL